ncbi:MAG: cytidine deaminase [Bacteroidetes bacterium]|nr:cytidine deaminase [Bacteroidota bacterium]
MKNTFNKLAKRALAARKRAYVPYSNFHVGAALLCKSGKIYTACNIENSSFSLTICAERVVLYKAISDGELSFEAIAVASDSDEYTRPCGACRQVILELAGNIPCIMVNNKGNYEVNLLNILLPEAFTKNHLK